MPGDENCTMEKTVRLRLGKELPWLGLTIHELAAKKRWDNLPEKEKEIYRERGRNLSKKSGVVTPCK